MKEPLQSDDALLTDILAMAEVPDQLHLWWLGQSGFLLCWQGHFLLLDPYLSDSLTKKYALTDKPHVRMTRRVIDPSRLDMVEIVTSSHNHTDHLDAETLLPMLATNPGLRLVVPAANQDFAAERLSCSAHSLTPIDVGQSLTLGKFQIHGVPAAHESIERDELGRYRYLGYVIECGPWKIYHSGDTIPYEGQVELLRDFHIDVALLPINGRLPERRVAGNLWGEEAAELAHAAGMKLVIPCHFDMFAFNTTTTESFISRCAHLSQSYRVMQNGERFSSPVLTRR